MSKYSVNKYFGHFWQCWEVIAESEEDAWQRAEKDGDLLYQQVYEKVMDSESKGYVMDMGNKEVREKKISTEQYYEWLEDAISKGMIVPDRYKRR